MRIHWTREKDNISKWAPSLVIPYLDFAPCVQIGDKMQVAYKGLTQDGVKSKEAKSKFYLI